MIHDYQNDNIIIVLKYYGVVIRQNDSKLTEIVLVPSMSWLNVLIGT